jgi:hypothetical protein
VLNVARLAVVPHLKYAVVLAPLGLTLPLSVAELTVTKLAIDVVAAGSLELVEKLSIAPFRVPALFWLASRK